MTHEETTMSVPKHHLPVHAEGRKATWFELLFDLVFVVAVAQLSGAYAHHYNLAGAAQFVVAFLAMWWCWLVHTFHGTRFDQDLPRQRAVGFLQVGAVTLIAYAASAPIAERAAPGALNGTSAVIYGGGLLMAFLGLALPERARPGRAHE
jgi:low temperature requirement protein LtrA